MSLTDWLTNCCLPKNKAVSVVIPSDGRTAFFIYMKLSIPVFIRFFFFGILFHQSKAKQSKIVKANMESANGASYVWSFEERRLSIMKIKTLTYYVRVE